MSITKIRWSTMRVTVVFFTGQLTHILVYQLIIPKVLTIVICDGIQDFFFICDLFFLFDFKAPLELHSLQTPFLLKYFLPLYCGIKYSWEFFLIFVEHFINILFFYNSLNASTTISIAINHIRIQKFNIKYRMAQHHLDIRWIHQLVHLQPHRITHNTKVPVPNCYWNRF